MIPRLLSVAAPLFVYASLVVLGIGIWRARHKLEWLSVIPALAGLAGSFLFLPPVHRLYFDEDIYINIASNLTHRPVAQLTLLGRPGDVDVSTYYKEPSGWPVLLSLIFLIAGASETAAFAAARVFFALAIAGVYHLARLFVETRSQALAAALLFGAAPAAFWFSVSAGTDIPAALMSVLGIWGLLTGNGPLAAGGFAMAAQTRLELIALMPVVWFSGKIPSKWAWTSAALIIAEVAHVGWVLSVSPVLAEAEKVASGFSPEYVPANLADNIKYLFNPAAFLAGASLLAIVAAWQRRRVSAALIVQFAVLFSVYLFFYAGSFGTNPRYSIQILAPLTILAASAIKRPVYLAGLVLSVVVPYLQAREFTGYLEALAADHRISVQFARNVGANDLIVSGSPQVFLNRNVRAMDAVYASTRKDKLEEEMRARGKTWYHAGARTNRLDSVDAEADRWMKSNFELHLIDSQEISGLRIAFYEVLLKPLDRKAR